MGEAREYFEAIIKQYGCCGITQQIKKVQTKGDLKATVSVEFQFLDKDGNSFTGDAFTLTEDTFELDEKGKCYRFISTSPDLDVVSFEMDKKEDADKISQIEKIIKEGETKKKDVV